MRGFDSKTLILAIELSQEQGVALRLLVCALVHSPSESRKRSKIFHDPRFCYDYWWAIVGCLPKVSVDESIEVDLGRREAASFVDDGVPEGVLIGEVIQSGRID